MSRGVGDNSGSGSGRTQVEYAVDDDAAYEALPATCRKLLQDAPMKLSAIEMLRRLRLVGEQQFTREFHAAVKRLQGEDVIALYGKDHPQAPRPSHGR